MWIVVLLMLGADLSEILKRIPEPAAQRQLLQLAQGGDADAQVQAALLRRQGKLPILTAKQAEEWFQASLKARHPEACLEQARVEIDTKKDPEESLRCAVEKGGPEAQYLLGRLILNRAAAEDELERFDGLALLALSAKAGYSPAIRRWDVVAADLTQEDLERVEQKTKLMTSAK